MWELSNAIEHFEAHDYIKVDGTVTSFNNQLQLNIRKIRKAEEGSYDIKEYMPVSEFDIEEMYQELTGIIASIEDEYLSRLLKSFFVEDETFIKRFKFHSAAKSVHHGFIGGLLQHTLSVTRLCDFMAKNYPLLNRDLLLSAAICHDIGKLEELSTFPENDYTDAGNLMGHIVIGSMMVRDRIADIEGFPDMTRDQLIHCILAHHGELEFGSPKKPALIEAVALSFADNTDAKLETFKEALDESKDKAGWLGFNRMLDANIRGTL